MHCSYNEQSSAGSFVPDIDEALRIEVQLTRVIQVDSSLCLPFLAHLEVLQGVSYGSGKSCVESKDVSWCWGLRCGRNNQQNTRLTLVNVR